MALRAALFFMTLLLSHVLHADPGHLILMGGGSKPAEALSRFVQLAGGPEAVIAVLPTASEDPETPADYTQLFKGYGCRKVVVLSVKTNKDAQDPRHLESLRTASGLFFTGGDQRRITAALLGSPLLAQIKQQHAQGMVLGGTSAGTACMSAIMLTGDGVFDQIRKGAVICAEGLGFAKSLILDQHFIARSRQTRLLSVVLESPQLIGVGVDEATAIEIYPDTSFEVLGKGWVDVYDARKALIRTDPKTGQLSAANLTQHVLTAGDRYDPVLGRVFPAGQDAAKEPTP